MYKYIYIYIDIYIKDINVRKKYFNLFIFVKSAPTLKFIDFGITICQKKHFSLFSLDLFKDHVKRIL